MSIESEKLTNQSCGELARQIQRPIVRRLALVFGLVAIALILLALYEAPHSEALAWIVCGSFIPVLAWCRLRNPGLPLVALVALQALAVFATPIIINNPGLATYTDGDIRRAGIEVFLFCCALAAGWRIAFGVDRPAPEKRRHWGLSVIRIDKPDTLFRSAVILIGASALYQIALTVGVLDPLLGGLPGGLFSIIRTLFDATALAGGLIGGFAIGGGMIPRSGRMLFWFFFALLLVGKFASILLSSTMGVIAATSLGYLLGARRPPWVFIAVIACVLSFLNLSKFEMRAKYWSEAGYSQGVALFDLPGYFAEWSTYSLNILTFNRSISAQDEAEGQRMTDRLNNMQNLLFAQSAIQDRDLPLLRGETYLLVPKLLIPRFLWPEKPRTHEGQVLLNVHFGRQRLDDTYITYIAWGLLAEAYGNYGAIWGAIICGLVIGVAAGGLERWIRPYPVTSLEAFFFLIMTLNFSLSFEMVASVWITSVFQMLVAMLCAVAPFAQRRLSAAPVA